MTTIILVVVGILLAAAAVLMLVFYGGDAFNEGDAKAEATRLVSEGVQIQAAVQAFRATEDRMPGKTNTGVDAFAMKELVCKDFLTNVPRGASTTAEPDYRSTCSTADGLPATANESAWKVDYKLGIARSVIGRTDDSKALGICQAARAQLGLPGEPMECSSPTISTREPCCTMSEAEANS